MYYVHADYLSQCVLIFYHVVDTYCKILLLFTLLSYSLL